MIDRSTVSRLIPALTWLVLTGLTVPAMADAPKVKKLVPKNGDTQVDPGLRKIRVVFDRDMDMTRHSLCGGGETFPEVRGRPKWVDARTFVVKVRLKPNHEYQMSVNCPSAQDFRSKGGTPVEPLRWTFSTAPDKADRLSKKKQRSLNKKCLAQLMKLLETRYSYYEVRDVDWKKLKKKHRKKIENAKSTRDWIKRTADMLSAAHDMHLWLKYKGSLTPTFSRDIRRNFTLEGIKTVLPSFTQRNRCVFTARTSDDIGYIMITSLSQNRAEHFEEVQAFLEEYADCKGLILDLRPNSGGAEPLAMPIAAWFIEGKKVYAKNVSRDPESKSGFSKAYERTIEGNDTPQRYKGPVAVLTGPGIMSSGEAFVLMMKQGEDVKLIGAKTYGSSGNPHPHLLDNDVEAYLPSWKALRPDGSCFEGEGIRPDIKVKAKSSAFKKGDPVLERALKYLRTRISKND